MVLSMPSCLGNSYRSRKCRGLVLTIFYSFFPVILHKEQQWQLTFLFYVVISSNVYYPTGFLLRSISRRQKAGNEAGNLFSCFPSSCSFKPRDRDSLLLLTPEHNILLCVLLKDFINNFFSEPSSTTKCFSYCFLC